MITADQIRKAASVLLAAQQSASRKRPADREGWELDAAHMGNNRLYRLSQERDGPDIE